MPDWAMIGLQGGLWGTVVVCGLCGCGSLLKWMGDDSKRGCIDERKYPPCGLLAAATCAGLCLAVLYGWITA